MKIGDTDTMTPDTRTRLDRYGESGALDHFLTDVSESDRGPFRDLVGSVNAGLHAFSREQQRIQAAREWSEEGRQTELGKLKQKLKQTASKWPLADRATKARADLAEVEHAALGGLVRHGSAGYVKTTPTERTAEQVAVAREIRDRLSALAGHERRTLYLSAVQSGDDPDLVDAVERAPKAFPVVDAQALAEGREWKIERSDFAPRRRELQALSQAYEQLHELVRLDLADLGF